MKKISSHKDMAIVKVPARLDMVFAQAMMDDLDDKIQTGRKVILDFSRTYFIGPEAVDVFWDALAKATLRRARLALRSVQPGVQLQLEQEGILEYFRGAKGRTQVA